MWWYRVDLQIKIYITFTSIVIIFLLDLYYNLAYQPVLLPQLSFTVFSLCYLSIIILPFLAEF